MRSRRSSSTGRTSSAKRALRRGAHQLVADPRTHADASAIEAKTALAEATVKDIDALHRAVNEIRAAKAKLDAGAPGPAPADRAAKLEQLSRVEEALMQVNMKGSEANLAFPGMLNEQYATFAAMLEDADAAPTSQELARFKSLHDQLGLQLAAWATLRSRLAA